MLPQLTHRLRKRSYHCLKMHEYYFIFVCVSVCKVYFVNDVTISKSASRVRAPQILTRLALIFLESKGRRTMICIILVAGHGILLEEEISLQVGW